MAGVDRQESRVEGEGWRVEGGGWRVEGSRPASLCGLPYPCFRARSASRYTTGTVHHFTPLSQSQSHAGDAKATGFVICRIASLLTAGEHLLHTCTRTFLVTIIKIGTKPDWRLRLFEWSASCPETQVKETEELATMDD